jgi:hypothetical protein
MGLQYDDALNALASATHAAQDADQHDYEEWSYKGILDFAL